jgi:hypothetical protein
MLAVLLNVPENADDWNRFSLHHDLDHREIAAAILARGGPRLPTYPLDPILLNDPSQFLENNSHAHTDMNAILGLNSTDLLDVDLADQSQLVSWIALHAQEHQNARQRLKI